jgi:hypothetical protein
MVHALLASCILSSGSVPCSTHNLSPGTYRIIAVDASHSAMFTVSVRNAASSEHEATVETYVGDPVCSKLAPLEGEFSLFPGVSHDVSGQLEPNQSVCVRIYRGAVVISIRPGGVQSQVTWESQTRSFRSLSSLCSVRATRLHCSMETLTTGTYRIVTATADDVQAGLVFVGGRYRPGPNGLIVTRVNLAKPAGEVHLFLSNGSCEPISPRMKTHLSLLDQAFHDGGQMSTNTVVNRGDTLCVSITGIISFAAP